MRALFVAIKTLCHMVVSRPPKIGKRGEQIGNTGISKEEQAAVNLSDLTANVPLLGETSVS